MSLSLSTTRPRGGYHYKGTQQLKPERAETAWTEIADTIAQNRQAISQIAARLRWMASQRNSQIAQALHDGVTVTAIAKATACTTQLVRAMGAASEDLYKTGTSRAEHIAMLEVSSIELQQAEAYRAELENKRVNLIAAASEHKKFDAYEMARLTRLAPAEISKMMRGKWPKRSNRSASPARTRHSGLQAQPSSSSDERRN
ncbi:hypothetical protein [Pseudarthrobacter enclensis]|uniref:hypothetical protein n=1 Tax=Pseudarthrobacter enclensis TaxID=993070 RepID=UPI003EE0CFF2